MLHHPGCWVSNNGCATTEPHEAAPQAMAYPDAERPPGAPARHPGEGTRTAPPPSSPPHPPQPTTPDPVVGATQFVRRQLPEEVAPPIGSGPRRPRRPEDVIARKSMPRIYDRHRWLGYWYVPAAVILAALVAVGIIWAADQLLGGSTPPASPSPTPAPAGAESPTPTPPAFATPATPTQQASPAPTVSGTVGPGRFTAGQRLIVTGTGDCLNVRTAPGTANDAIVCLQDGSEVTVTGGPQQAGNFTWWKVQTRLGEGWAVENYLTPAP